MNDKKVGRGGIQYEGYLLLVGEKPGAYVLNSSIPKNGAVNSISITTEKYGVGDHYKIEHIINDEVAAVICQKIYNIGHLSTMNFDFSEMQRMEANEILRLTYNNIASTAMNIYMHVERVGVRA